MKKLLLITASLLAMPAIHARTMQLADPTIYAEGDTYYMYGTGSPSDYGFEVYTSRDLVNWEGPAGAKDGFALTKGDAFGTWGFWAPQVIKEGGKYYMIYTADEQIAVAGSASPLGPFTNATGKALEADTRRIDPFVLRASDGKTYLYHVRLDGENRICCSSPSGDLLPVVSAEAGTWEDTADADWRVCEGPTVIEYGGKYHLFYSANDFRNIDYAVGHAVADSPEGPWTKSPQPVISRHKLPGLNGTGHGDIFTDMQGNLRYVFHAHASENSVAPRQTLIITLVPTADGNFDLDPDSLIFPKIPD